MFKKIIVTISLVIGISLAMPMTGLTNGSASAASCGDATDANFLSFPTWHRGLPCDANGRVDLQGQQIGNIVIIVALNIIDIVLRMLSIVAIGFIIFGGFLYLTAQGEANRVAKGKAAIRNAIVGLIIGIASSAIVGFLVGRIGG